MGGGSDGGVGGCGGALVVRVGRWSRMGDGGRGGEGRFREYILAFGRLGALDRSFVSAWLYPAYSSSPTSGIKVAYMYTTGSILKSTYYLPNFYCV